MPQKDDTKTPNVKDGVNQSVASLKKSSRIIIKEKESEQIQRVIFPNTIQAGVPGLNRGGIVIPSSSPSSTTNRLYNEGGTLKFNGQEIGTGGGATPGGSDSHVQFNSSGDLEGDSAFTYESSTETLSVSNVSIASDLYVERNVFVTGSTTLAGITDATTDLYVARDIFVTGSTTLNGITNSATDLYVGRDVFVTGSTTLAGITDSATDLYVGRNVFVTGSLGVGTSLPKTSFSVVHDYATTTFENQLSDNEGGGHIIKYGAGTLSAGKLYFLHTNGTWTETDSGAESTGGFQLLGVSLGSSPTSNGVLLKGYVKVSSDYINGTAQIGYPVYVDDGTSGEYNFTAPSGSGDFVRIVGYCVDIDSSDILLYFDPDKTWVVRT